MDNAFQADAFQNDAFQVVVAGAIILLSDGRLAMKVTDVFYLVF